MTKPNRDIKKSISLQHMRGLDKCAHIYHAHISLSEPQNLETYDKFVSINTQHIYRSNYAVSQKYANTTHIKKWYRITQTYLSELC